MTEKKKPLYTIESAENTLEKFIDEVIDTKEPEAEVKEIVGRKIYDTINELPMK